ncbi:Alstrom syndrome protein 1 [Bufo gargarizans]|uniref:Alstrom syndrome protein 1 n=1 Tax=Bufo gargarizans TaxID=30331 RepID=UPI001CF48BF3|nr:Alstrom syndrome protein 1 [Bufo gargarizans]
MEREEAAAEAAESWYQLPAEEDASITMPTFGETAAPGEHTDFPSVEEGTLLSEPEMRKDFSAGRMDSVRLEIQDSRLSPCLPLLTTLSTSGDKFFGDTLFQKTVGDDFAPLRASLDMSEFPGPPSKLLQMSDAVELASKEITIEQEEVSICLSQHYLRTTLDDNGDGGGLHPFSLSHGEKDDRGNELESEVIKLTLSDDVIQPKVDEMSKDLGSEDGAFLSSSVPAPVLMQLLEKEVSMSSSSGRSSRRSSKSSSAGGSENIQRTKRESDLEHQNLNIQDPGTTCNQSLEESFRDSSQIDFVKDIERETEDPSGITLRQMREQSFQPVRDSLHKQLCSEIQQLYQERKTSEGTKSEKESISPESTPLLNKTPSEPPNKVDETVVEDHLKEELSRLSRCSIERGHKDTEMSHTGNTPVDEASFIGKLPHPVSQSTPGTFTMNRKPLSGRIQQIKAKLTGSDMSLNEEPSTESSAHKAAPSAVVQSIQSSQGYPESSDSQRSLSPQRQRIQSLPSLNYIEKVGAWNTNQTFDALVLRGLTGVSPKKLAYNAVADSLNRMFSRQTSATTPNKGPSATVKATSSMTNLSVAERDSTAISQIARSQSYNSVLPGRDQTEAEAHETPKSETSQSHVSLRGSSSTVVNSSEPVQKNTSDAGVRERDLPAAQTTSEFKKSHGGQEKMCDGSGNQSRNFVTMDRFSDVSSDQEYADSSHSSNKEKGSLTSAKHHLTGGEGNDWSPTEETSGKEELDIEERIPTYLRNLGIDQSPTTILTPFAPKGPIREPEFSPSELRTIKGSTATPSRSMRLSEGGSQSAVNISQSSLYSSTSTTSVSIPMGSDVGPESPLPTELSPAFGSGSADDRPISQDDTMTRGVGSGLEVHHVERSPAIEPVNDLNSPSQGFMNEENTESAPVKQLIEQFESGGYDGTISHDSVHEQVSSLQGYSQKTPTIDPVNDSFVGSKTLKEIRKLLAEAEDIGLDRTSSSLQRASPVGDPYTEAPSRCLNLEDSLNSRSASPLDLQVKDMSWDLSFNSSLTGDHLGNKDLSTTWNSDTVHSSSVRDNSYLGELIGIRNTQAAPFSQRSQWGRSEPEGCSKATTNKMMPSTANVRGEREFVDVTEKVQRSEHLLSSVSSSVGGLKNALALTGSGYVRGRETESDESSGDSLAARVTNLLRNDAPSVRTRQSAEEEERRARGSVKLKLTGRSVTPDTELSEEDRRRIEEIKRELLDGAKKAEKDYSHPNKLASSGDMGEFRLQLTPSPFQLPLTRSQSSEGTKNITSSVQASDVQQEAKYGGMTKDLSSVMSDLPPPTSASYQQDPLTGAAGRTITELKSQNMAPAKSTEEATKPISSITFSSRKRSSPLPGAPDEGSQPRPSDLQVVFDKSLANQGLNRRPSPEPSVSNHVHRFHHQDYQADKDVLPALATFQQWRPGESTTKEYSPRSWATEKEYSAAASILWTSGPTVENFSTFPCPPKENEGSQPRPSDLQVVFDKSPANQGLNRRPSPEPSVSNHVHRFHHQDYQADKDVLPALATSQQWCPGESTTQEYSPRYWATEKEYSAAASILWTSGPTPKENVDPGRVNSEDSILINHGLQQKNNSGGGQLKTYSGLTSEDGLLPLSAQELQTRPAISSPTRKALSCIHVTISPKDDMKVLDVSKALVTLDTDNGSLAPELRTNGDMSRSSSSNLSRNDQVLSCNDLSAGTVPVGSSHVIHIRDRKTTHEDIVQLMGKENLPHRSIQTERRSSPLSDATTQITTESPQKTTFSSEIFVDGSLREASTSSILRVNETPERQTPSRSPLSCLSRATDQPLLLPYRPSGSPELFYVPFMGGGSRMSPVSTIESSHPGSNDAISPKFPPDVLGSATEKLPDPSLPRHREGIYSKEPSPKTAEWKQKPARGRIDDLKSSQRSSSPSPPQSLAEKDPGSFGNMSSSTVHPRHSESMGRSDPRGLQPAPSPEDSEFLPLQPEIYYSQDQANITRPARSKALEVTVRKKTHSVTSTDLPGQGHKSGQTPGKPRSSTRSSLDRSISRSQSVVSNQSLDDLWTRYTEGRRRQATESSNKLEVSLVERLERLARLLQNPPSHSLTSSKDEKKEDNHEKKAAREQWYRKKLEVDDDSVGKPYEDSPDSGSLLSEPLSEVRSSVTDSATTTTASQVGSETSSGSMSTIDTIRLINAFGAERVLPSSRLSRLYSTIDLQKKRTEETAKGSKRASVGRGQSRVAIQELPKSKMADAESVTSSDGLREPTPALREKKSSRRQNKGVQAGELEIVMSATRKNTRDVGTTFPSPGGERLTGPAASENMEANVRTSKSKVNTMAQYVPPGLSWFVPAEDLKSESRKENMPGVPKGPGPVWYEPVTNTKPWREPLREKNEQDWATGRPGGPIHSTRVIPDAQAKPFIRVTLQEYLRSHRPDFIFRSRERVKRLQLLAEERKLQSVFQGERDELFNQTTRSRVPPYKDSRLFQQSRTVPKKEMIQRSKRIYQQLPEIRKRKEEEKRRSEYETYRLKAQLFRKKVTNQILGRKTPWN